MSGLLGTALTTGSSLVGIGRQVAGIAGVTADDLGPLGFLLGNQRSIDSIVPDVVLTEHHTDRMTITQHPIVEGTPIADHAFMLPVTLTMQCGFSNSNIINSAMQGFSAGGGLSDIGGGLLGAGKGLLSSFTEQRIKDIYDKLRKLQRATAAEGKVYRITTGKRTYENMGITELSVTTDRHSEYSLFISCSFQEIIKVRTQSAKTAPQQDQAKPEKTAETQEGGDKQANPAPLKGPLGAPLKFVLPGIFK